MTLTFIPFLLPVRARKRTRRDTESADHCSQTSSPLSMSSPRTESDKGHESPFARSPTPLEETCLTKLQNDSTSPYRSSSLQGDLPLSSLAMTTKPENISKAVYLEEVMLTSSSGDSKRPPLDILCRVFPSMKRGVLQLILQGNNNDTVQAIEQILNNHSGISGGPEAQSGNSNSALPLPLSNVEIGTAFGALRAGAGLFPQTYMPSNLGSLGFKSAFSPISCPPTAHFNSIRYTYGALPATRAGSMATTLAIPYPPLLPGLALGTSYSYGGLSTSDKTLQYAVGCSCCPAKPYSSHSSEKSSGCIGK